MREPNIMHIRMIENAINPIDEEHAIAIYNLINEYRRGLISGDDYEHFLHHIFTSYRGKVDDAIKTVKRSF